MRPAGFVLLLSITACASPKRAPGSCDGPCPASKIDHVVIVVQENHTFDNYFGRYCTAPAGSAPTCTTGPGCCEAGPANEPGGAAPTVLDDTANGAFDPDHSKACELAKANGGAMDRYVTGAAACSDPQNFAYADAATSAPYTAFAASGAIADRYFQPLAGQSAANDMYLARAQFVFDDNAFRPDAIGGRCSLIPTTMMFTGPTIGDLLDTANVSWAFYAEGYQAAVTADAAGRCAPAPHGCPLGLGIYPCVYDPSDVPFEYYAADTDNPRVMRDYAKLAHDLSSNTLPQVVFVKGAGYHTEHPGQEDAISDGAAFIGGVVDAVQASDYAPDTLVLVTWDEGGGYFDHIAPPGNGSDGHPYGTRVPLIAIGPFTAPNTISHVTMEHSSIVKFIEWNWLGMQTGQLGGRDVAIANLGSLLDPTTTGVAVPQ